MCFLSCKLAEICDPRIECILCFLPLIRKIFQRFFLFFQGKRGTSSNGGGGASSRDTEGNSEQISGDHGSTTTGESRFLMPPLLRVDPASDIEDDEVTAASSSLQEGHLNASTQANSSRFIRNGSELRRSLRRINSMTKRKLSPTSLKSPKGESKRKHSHDSGSIHSQKIVSSKVEPDYNSCLT